MTDPGIEAARKATEGKVSHFMGPGRYALIGAREALGPIRELHDRWSSIGVLPPEAWQILDEIGDLIFTSEELER